MGNKGYLLARHKNKRVACCFDLEWLLNMSRWRREKILNNWEVIYICER